MERNRAHPRVSSQSKEWAAWRRTCYALIALMLVLLTLWGPWLLGRAGAAISRAPRASDLTLSMTSYTDARLGFTLDLPPGWQVLTETSAAPTPALSAVAIAPGAPLAFTLLLTIQQGADMPSRFAQQVQVSTHIGAYPASAAVYAATAQMPTTCEERVFLASTDYVDATWCGGDAITQSATVEQVLGSFQPSSIQTTSLAGMSATLTQGTALAGSLEDALRTTVSQGSHTPESCRTLQQNAGYQGTLTWGTQLASATATSPLGGWAHLKTGTAICSNKGSPDGWLFQCTELANRFIRERWGLGALPETGDLRPGLYAAYLAGNAGMYLDWWGIVNGSAPKHFYGSADDKSDIIRYSDARWAAQLAPFGYHVNATKPVPGDLLIWQDVNTPAKGPASGTPARRDAVGGTSTIYPGHVAIVTNVTASTIDIAQQNYNDTQYFDAIPYSRGPHGGWIIDPDTAARSGDPASIFVGWIHFTEADGTSSTKARPTPTPTPTPVPTPTRVHLPPNLAPATPVVITGSTNEPEVFLRTTSEQIVHSSNQGGTWTPWQPVGDASTPIASDPALTNDGAVYARSATDNQIRESQWTGSAWTPWTVIGGTLPGGFIGNPVVSTMPSVTSSTTQSTTNTPFPAVYALSAKGLLYTTSLENGAWLPWQPIGDTTPLTGTPAVVNSTQIYIRSASGHQILQSMWTTAGWSAWTSIGGNLPGGFAGDPEVSLPPSGADLGYPAIFATSTAGQISMTYVENGAWVPWEPVGDATPIGSNAAPLNSGQVYARSTKDNQIRMSTWAAGQWSAWTVLGGTLPSGFVGNIVAALPTVQADDRFAMIFAVDQQGDVVFTAVQHGQWMTWQQVGDASATFA